MMNRTLALALVVCTAGSASLAAQPASTRFLEEPPICQSTGVYDEEGGCPSPTATEFFCRGMLHEKYGEECELREGGASCEEPGPEETVTWLSYYMCYVVL